MRAEVEIEYYETSLSTISQSLLPFAREERFELLNSEIFLENSDLADPLLQNITKVRFRVFHLPSHLTT